MQFHVVTLFPEFFESPLKTSLLGKAIQNGVLSVQKVNPRDFTPYKHGKVDAPPYGGGAGMVMMVEPIARAVAAIRESQPKTHTILLSARGRLFDAAYAQKLSQEHTSIALICGHYEGVDERVAESVADESLRIGNFVLSGGEVAALAVIDSVARRLSGFMGNKDSLSHESFDEGLSFEHPQYTRPEEWQGLKVPEVLLSGNHAKIETWRKQKAQEDAPRFT